MSYHWSHTVNMLHQQQQDYLSLVVIDFSFVVSLGYESQFPIFSHSSWSLLGPGHHEWYVTESLDSAMSPWWPLTWLGSNCPPVVSSSWNLLLAFSSSINGITVPPVIQTRNCKLISLPFSLLSISKDHFSRSLIHALHHPCCPLPHHFSSDYSKSLLTGLTAFHLRALQSIHSSAAWETFLREKFLCLKSPLSTTSA